MVDYIYYRLPYSLGNDLVVIYESYKKVHKYIGKIEKEDDCKYFFVKMGQESNYSKDIADKSYHTPTIAASQDNYPSNVIQRLVVEFIEPNNEFDKILFLFVFLFIGFIIIIFFRNVGDKRKT